MTNPILEELFYPKSSFFRNKPEIFNMGLFRGTFVKIFKVCLRINKTRRSQKLTPRQPKGNKIRGIKFKTSTQKLKSQYVSSAKQSEN